MKLQQKITLIAGAIAFSITGCDVGNAPAGMSPDEARANFERQKPEEQIRIIQTGPGSTDQKAARIAEIRKKYNLPDSVPNSANPGTTMQPGGSFPGDPRQGTSK